MSTRPNTPAHTAHFQQYDDSAQQQEWDTPYAVSPPEQHGKTGKQLDHDDDDQVLHYEYRASVTWPSKRTSKKLQSLLTTILACVVMVTMILAATPWGSRMVVQQAVMIPAASTVDDATHLNDDADKWTKVRSELQARFAAQSWHSAYDRFHATKYWTWKKVLN